MLDRVHPLRRRARRHARDAVPVRLLLHAAGVGHDHASLRRERHEVQVRERRDQPDLSGGQSLCRNCNASARMGRKDDGLCDAPQPVEDPLEARRDDVRVPVDRRDDVRPRLELEPFEHVGTLARDRVRTDGSRPPSRRRRPRSGPGTPSASRIARERSSGHRSRSATPSTSMRLCSSGIVRSPERIPASTWASGMPVSRAARAPGERRVRVAEDDDRVRPLGRDRSHDSGLHGVDVARVRFEPVGRLGEPELLEEDVGQLAVVVLPRVQHDLVDPRLPEGDRKRPGLHELRPVAYDGKHLHPVGSLGARAVSSAGRAGDS